MGIPKKLLSNPIFFFAGIVICINRNESRGWKLNQHFPCRNVLNKNMYCEGKVENVKNDNVCKFSSICNGKTLWILGLTCKQR